MCGSSRASRVVSVREISIGGFAYIGGRPWLMGMRVRQDWHRGELELFTDKPHGQRVKCDMKTGELLYFLDGRLEEEEQDEVEEISYEESFSSR